MATVTDMIRLAETAGRSGNFLMLSFYTRFWSGQANTIKMEKTAITPLIRGEWAGAQHVRGWQFWQYPAIADKKRKAQPRWTRKKSMVLL